MLTNENRSVRSIANRVLSWRSKYLHYTPFLHVSKCCVRDSNMIYGPWNGNISNFTWRVPWSRCIPSIHPQNICLHTYTVKNLRSMKVKRKQLNYVCSYFTNWLWLFSPYKLPAHWVSKIAALVYWFREWMEEKRESKRKT